MEPMAQTALPVAFSIIPLSIAYFPHHNASQLFLGPAIIIYSLVRLEVSIRAVSELCAPLQSSVPLCSCSGVRGRGTARG